MLHDLFQKNFSISGKISSHVNGTKILRICGKTFVEDIQRISEICTPQEKWNTPKIIKNQSNKIQLSYLRGFFDAEGGLPKNPEKAKQKYISFSQKNMESLEFLQNILRRNKFTPTNLTRCGGVWEFRLTRKKDIINFYFCVGSWHSDKKMRLKILKDGLIST